MQVFLQMFRGYQDVAEKQKMADKNTKIAKEMSQKKLGTFEFQ